MGVSGSQFTKLVWSVGSQFTKLVWSVGSQHTKMVWSVGSQFTKLVLSVGSQHTKLVWSVGSQHTNSQEVESCAVNKSPGKPRTMIQTDCHCDHDQKPPDNTFISI